MKEQDILKLASVSNLERKKHIKNGTVPDVPVKVEEGMCIATRHLGRNGSLVSELASTIQVAEIPHVVEREIHFVGGIRKRLEDGKSNSRNYSQGERVHGTDGISPCLSAQMGGTANGSILIMEGINDMREINGKPIKRPPLVERMKKRLKAIPEINLIDMNIPLTNGKPTPKLKDILEKEVDDKYYLRKDIVEKIVKESGFEERLVSLKTPYQRGETQDPNVGSDITYCLDASYHKGANTTKKSRRQLIAEGNPEDLNIIQMNDPVHSNNRIYSEEGISPTLNTMGGGNRQPFVYEDQTTVAYSKSTRETHIDHRGKVDGEANTISTGDGGGNQSTQNFVVQYNRKDGIGKEIETAATLNSSDWRGLNRNQTQNAVLECLTPNAKYKSENVYSDEGIGPCLQAHQGGTAGNSALTTNVAEPYRIRKLTPVECNRLQGWRDDLNKYGRRVDGTVYEMTNTQRYKQAGNGVSSPVPAYILSKIIPKDEKIDIFSLFTGVAGTEQDLDPEQYKTVAFCEFDKYASDVLRYNHPDIRNYHDVTKVLENPDEELPKCNMITGGFSCQPWSSAGLRQGFNDEKGRGDVVFHMLKIIEKLKPKYTLFENVKGLLTFDKGNAFVEICKSLSELGYEFDFEMLNSKHFGLAQNRERVFIIGRRKES